MRISILFLALFLAHCVEAKTIDVRLFSTAQLQQSWVSTHGAPFYLIALHANGALIDTVADFADYAPSKSLHVLAKSGSVIPTQGGENFGPFDGLMLVPKNENAHFIIKGKGAERIYSGALIFKNVAGKLLIVNRVPLEEYVAGVVESEGGREHNFAYFKAQAVLARTWVLKNMNKHIKEGYNVRDDVSSQAYYSKAYLQNSEEILRAVRETKDTILVDAAGKPIFGAFHSNSGGQTANSEDVWSGKIDYLRSVPDTFSLQMDKAFWTKEIDKKEFVGFFALKTGQSANDKEFAKAVCNFEQNSRMAYFKYKNGLPLKLRWVRQKFNLRSTYFSVEEKSNTVVLHGRGFGHGVGLSQQGAMRMSQLGYNYKTILKHYFKNVKFGLASSV